MQRITWKRVPREAGLAGIGYNNDRGWNIRVDGESVGAVGPTSAHLENGTRAWHWWASVNGKLRNSAAERRRFCSPDEAAADCEDWVRQALGLPPRKSPPRLGKG
jgi:hypothetical protein